MQQVLWSRIGPRALMGTALLLGAYGMFVSDSFQLRTSFTKPGLTKRQRLVRLWYGLTWAAPLAVELLNPGRLWPVAALMLLRCEF